MTPLQREREIGLLAVGLSLALLACFGPSLAQSPHHHDFADQRLLWGIPCAMDVLSNLPFALWALVGGWALWCTRASGHSALVATSPHRGCATLFFAGLAVTAVGSTWYHLQPNDAGLALDRLGMVAAFAGLLGLAVADRVSARSGMATAALVLLAGPLAVGVWAQTGNVLPWAVVQFGGMLVVVGLACFKPPHGGPGLPLGAIIAIYAVAKAFEMADHAIYDLTAHTVSGHSLKHIVASFAAWPVVRAMWPTGMPRLATKSGQNGPQTTKTKAVA